MDFLARREYGQAELIKKLADKGFVSEIAERAVIKLTEEGLQSDRRFAESFVQSRVNQGKGPVRIRIDLGQRGISEDAIEAALDEVGADWYRLAREIRDKKFGSSRPADFAEKAKQMRFLQYRGFEPDHTQAAVRGGDD
ncbi:MAG: recombination regulator RecX [Gammaproteobacteria bacterium]|nr:recombination regulator RecX [Gammaproteobacteria bacterium]MDH3363428.1 recombination regulator RecX [Gammaproteobacteria bacterium]